MNVKAKQGIKRGVGAAKGISGGKSKVAGPFDKKIAQLGEALDQVDAPVLDEAAFLKRAVVEVLEGQSFAQTLAYSDEELSELAKQGRGLVMGGKLLEAKKIFAGLVALDPQVPFFKLSLANVLAALDEQVEAMDAFDDGVECARATQDSPILAQALLQRCQFLKKHGAGKLAKEDFAEAQALKGGALSFSDVQETKTLLAA